MLHSKDGVNKPADYVEVQRAYNEVHKNGKSIFKERACDDALELCKLISLMGWKAESVLDVGCRLGYAMDVFQSNLPAARVAGVDLVPEFVTEADDVSEAYTMDMHDLKFKDGEFDWVFCTQVLEHAYDPTKALRELFRVANQGIYLAVPVGESEESFEFNKSHLWKSDGILDWIELMLPQRAKGWDLFFTRYDQSSQSMYAILTRKGDE